MVHDGDLDFTNDFSLSLRQPNQAASHHHFQTPVTAASRPDNNYTVGLPLLVTPIYLAGNILFAPFYAATAFPLFLDQMIYSYASLFLGLLGMWLTYRFVAEYFSERESLLATISFWLCSPLIYYFSREPFMSHLASVFAVSLLLCIWKIPALTTPIRTFLIGMAAGIVAMVRQQDIVILVIPAGVALAEGALKWPCKKLLTSVFLTGIGFFITFAIQMMVWYSVRGSFLTYSYRGQSFDYVFSPKIIPVLFSSNHGLLSWHPLIMLCILGWFQFRRLNVTMSRMAMACFVLQLYVIASWCSWWMGTSFGNRGFLGLTPIFVLGLAAFYSNLAQTWTRRLFVSAVAVLFVWNVTLMLAYVSELIPYEGDFSWRALIAALPYLPFQIIGKMNHL
jgi:hypothetical protein